MVQLIICEDQQFYRDHLRREIETYVMIEEYDFEVILATADPEKVLQLLSETSQRNVYFLDVDLQHDVYDGFSLGKEIRKKDPRGFIIYVTTHEELAFETFKYRVEALDYVIKDDALNFVKRVHHCLDSIVERISDETSDDRRYYTVKVFDELRHIPVEDILLVETSNQNHRLIIHTNEQSLEFFGNLNAVSEELGHGFMRVHRSYLVQLSAIEGFRLKDGQLDLKAELTCDVARTKRKELQKKLNIRDR